MEGEDEDDEGLFGDEEEMPVVVDQSGGTLVANHDAESDNELSHHREESEASPDEEPEVTLA